MEMKGEEECEREPEYISVTSNRNVPMWKTRVSIAPVMHVFLENLFMIDCYFSNFLHISHRVFCKICIRKYTFLRQNEITVCAKLASIQLTYLCIVIHLLHFHEIER